MGTELFSGGYFQVKLGFKSYPFSGYLIDFSMVDLIRYLVHPYFEGKTIYIEGKPTPSNEITSFKIIKTDFLVEREIREQVPKVSIAEYFSSNNHFEQYKDYSPQFFQYYDKSATQKAIRELLNQESDLKQERANLIVQGGDSAKVKEYDDKIRRIGSNITYLLGSFFMGAIEHLH